MNHYKHPKFIKDLAHLFAVSTDDPVVEIVLETLLAVGINPAEPIYTMDGDRVRLLAIDPFHTFPVVGEVIDFGAETSWLARWSASGVYGSSSETANRRHALKPNDKPGRLYLDPALVVEDISVTMAEYFARTGVPAHVGKSVVDLVRESQAQPKTGAGLSPDAWVAPPEGFISKVADRPVRDGAVVDFHVGYYDASSVKVSEDGRKVQFVPAQPAGPISDPAGYVRTAVGSGGRVRHPHEQDFDASFAEACRAEKVTREPWDGLRKGWAERLGPINPNGAPAKLDPDNVRAGFSRIDVDAQLIANAKGTISTWTTRHRADRTLRTETQKHLDTLALERFYFDACTKGRISHDAHLWCVAAVYAVAGRLGVVGDPHGINSDQLEQALHDVRRLPPEIMYAVLSRKEQAA